VKVYPRLARKIRAPKCAGCEIFGNVAKVANRSGSVLDAEVYCEGTVNNRTERSDVASGFMKRGLETVCV
jgi:hypothetical protein